MWRDLGSIGDWGYFVMVRSMRIDGSVVVRDQTWNIIQSIVSSQLQASIFVEIIGLSVSNQDFHLILDEALS